MKRVLTSCLVVLICLTAFLSGYGKGCYSYATNQDGTLTNDELDVAVSSWLQSHGGSLFSPQNYRARKTYEAGLIHNFIYGDGGGYDVIRQHINGGVGGNNELKFDFDGFIIQKLNTWLNRKLQDGEFGNDVALNENGMLEDGINNELYNGIMFTDYDGITTLVYVVSSETHSNFGFSNANSIYNLIIKKGTPYKYDNGMLVNLGVPNTITYHLVSNTNTNISLTNYSGVWTFNGDYSKGYHSTTNDYIDADGFPIIYMVNDGDGYLNLGTYNIIKRDYNNRYGGGISKIQTIRKQNENDDNVNIFFITNNNNNVSVYPTIVDADGHLYITPKVNVGVDGEVNYQPYIINEGDTINNVINQYYIDSNTPDKTISYPSDNPNDSGGGGGSSDNPSGGNPPNWSNPFPHLSPDGEGGFNFNFTLPDLNIDWNISGLKDKFPFSIPFDLIHFVEVLNAEPETPEFDWTIDLKIYQWHIDADLHQFDNLAGIVRNVEFIGFCITLVLITRRMIKG